MIKDYEYIVVYIFSTTISCAEYDMSLDLLPLFIKENYEVHEWRHACAVLYSDFRNEWKDIIDVLTEFRLKKSWLTVGGGRKSQISKFIDNFLFNRGWAEKSFDTKVHIDGEEYNSPTHKIDCYRNKIALEIEWNNKDPFYDRDLNNFRLLFDLRAISAGIIITRCDDLQDIFNNLGRGASFGASTTHMSRLCPRINGGGGAGCPLLIFGITKQLYIEDE